MLFYIFDVVFFIESLLYVGLTLESMPVLRYFCNGALDKFYLSFYCVIFLCCLLFDKHFIVLLWCFCSNTKMGSLGFLTVFSIHSLFCYGAFVLILKWVVLAFWLYSQYICFSVWFSRFKREVSFVFGLFLLRKFILFMVVCFCVCRFSTWKQTFFYLAP